MDAETDTGRQQNKSFKLSKPEQRAVIDTLGIADTTTEKKAVLIRKVEIGITLYREIKGEIERAHDIKGTRDRLKGVRGAANKYADALESLDTWGRNLLTSQVILKRAPTLDELIAESTDVVTRTDAALAIMPRKRPKSINEALKMTLVRSLAMAFVEYAGTPFELSEIRGRDSALKFVAAVVEIVEPTDNVNAKDQNLRSVKEAMKAVIKERRATAK